MSEINPLSNHAGTNAGALSYRLFESATNLRRPLVFWSAIASFYILGDVHLNFVKTDNGTGIQTILGVQIVNVTENKFLIGLLIVQGYFFSRFAFILLSAIIARRTERRQWKLENDFAIYNEQSYEDYDIHWVEHEFIIDDDEAKYRDQTNRLNRILSFLNFVVNKFFPYLIPLLVGLYAFYILSSEIGFLQ